MTPSKFANLTRNCKRYRYISLGIFPLSSKSNGTNWPTTTIQTFVIRFGNFERVTVHWTSFLSVYIFVLFCIFCILMLPYWGWTAYFEIIIRSFDNWFLAFAEAMSISQRWIYYFFPLFQQILQFLTFIVNISFERNSIPSTRNA